MAAWQRQPALVRAVNAMMRALGGAPVKLRIAAASDAGTQRELGIAAAAYEETELAPVLVRTVTADKNVRPTATTQIEVLVASSAVEALIPAFGATDGESFLEMVRQIVYGDLVFAVTQVSAERFAGVAYMYRVTAVSTR